MTTTELLNLSVGTRLRWEEFELYGKVIERRGDVLQIVWSDGDVLEIAPADDDLGEFAGSLDITADPMSDEPLIVGGK